MKGIVKMKKLLFATVCFILAYISCNRSGNYIIPVDYEKYNDGATNRTEKENQELTMKLYMDWYHNTVGKEIPDIRVKDIEGKTIRLKKWLKGETILIFTDAYCGYGGEEVEQDFPNAINNMKDELEGIDILCLVELSEDSDQQKTVEYAKTLQGKYNHIFIIDQKDALRCNLAATPTKFFIDEKQIVKHIQMGFTFDENGSEYSIRQGVMMMQKENTTE